MEWPKGLVNEVEIAIWVPRTQQKWDGREAGKARLRPKGRGQRGKSGHGNDQAGAGFCRAAAIAVLHSGVEINGIFGFQEKFFAADFQRE